MGNGNTVQTNLGRITHTSFGKEYPFDIIFEGLNGKKTMKSYNYFYHFKNVKMVDYPIKTSSGIENEKLIYGEIYKSKLSAEHDVLDLDNLTYSTETQDELFSKNAFVIFKDLSIVFTSSVKFHDNQFIENFQELYRKNASELFANIKINYRNEDFDIFDKIHSFKRLIEVELKNVRKSNPSPKPTSQIIQKLLEKERADVLNAKFKSESPSGLSREEGSIPLSGIAAANDGYGDDSVIVGENPDGKVETIKLKDHRIRRRITIEEGDGFIRKIVEEYYPFVTKEDELDYG